MRARIGHDQLHEQLVGPSTVRRTPVKNAARGKRRRPFGPAITATASRAMRGGAMSAEGAALQRLPPTVARLRTWMEPTRAPLSAMEA